MRNSRRQHVGSYLVAPSKPSQDKRMAAMWVSNAKADESSRFSRAFQATKPIAGIAATWTADAKVDHSFAEALLSGLVLQPSISLCTSAGDVGGLCPLFAKGRCCFGVSLLTLKVQMTRVERRLNATAPARPARKSPNPRNQDKIHPRRLLWKAVTPFCRALETRDPLRCPRPSHQSSCLIIVIVPSAMEAS